MAEPQAALYEHTEHQLQNLVYDMALATDNFMEKAYLLNREQISYAARLSSEALEYYLEAKNARDEGELVLALSLVEIAQERVALLIILPT